MEKSKASFLASLGEAKRKEFLSAFSPAELHKLWATWQFWGRPSQLEPPGNWRIWLILAGRGWGKTRTGAEWLADRASRYPDSEWAIVAPTFAAARSVCVEGEGAFLEACEKRSIMENYNRSNFEIKLTNGATVFIYGADDPRGIVGRGRNLSGAWVDELAAFRYREVWDSGLMPALRMNDPRTVVTTTPRPVSLIRELVGRQDGSVHVTRGSTFDNAENLAPAALAELRLRYDGTRLGRQELYAEILEDVPGALWQRDAIDEQRVDELPEMVRVVIGVDPAVTSGEDADETGIVAVGLGVDGRAYVLADESCRLPPQQWASKVVSLYHALQADRIVPEVNNGGEMVALTLRTIDPELPIHAVHASRGKRVRAEPIAALYEQGRISHWGSLPELEDQMVTFLPEDTRNSPDRVDALVWALTDLMLGRSAGYNVPLVVAGNRSFG